MCPSVVSYFLGVKIYFLFDTCCEHIPLTYNSTLLLTNLFWVAIGFLASLREVKPPLGEFGSAVKILVNVSLDEFK